MTERQDAESFEPVLAARIRAYTDPAAMRSVDALAISRTAMSSARSAGWSRRALGGSLLGGRLTGGRWAVAYAAVVLVGVIGVAMILRPSDSAVGPQPTASSSSPGLVTAAAPIPEILRHAWQRPYAVTPSLDQWGTGFLTITSGSVEVGPEEAAMAPSSAITEADVDTLVVTATVETLGCAVGDVGAYLWSLAGNDTVMTLTPSRADACPAREEALAGQWVRSDLPPPVDGAAVLAPGTYLTSSFDPFGAPGVSGQLSYTVPERWKVKEDRAGAFLLHRLPDDTAPQRSMDTFIHLFTQARLMADYTEGAICGQSSEAPGVGREVDDIVAAILARPGVVSTRPTAVTIGGYEGQMLDLHLAPTWTGSCQLPDGKIIAMPLLLGPEFERSAGIGLVPDGPVRLILLDLTGGRTMGIGIYGGGPSEPSQLEEQVADAMPVVESFEFHPPRP